MKGYFSEYYQIDYMAGSKEFSDIMKCCAFYIENEWDQPWFENVQLCGQTITLQKSTNPMVCQRVEGDRPDWVLLEYKIVGWRQLPVDLLDCIPTLEPDLCVFAFSFEDDFGQRQVVVELFARRDYLESSEGKRFSTATKIVRLRTDFTNVEDDDE